MKRPVTHFTLAALALLFTMQSCAPKNYLAGSELSQYRIDGVDDPAPDRRIDSMIAPYRAKLSAVMDEVLGEVAVSMDKALPAGGLNNWFADALLRSSEAIFGQPADVAVQNYGGLRINSLGAGPLTRGKVYELMPFENMTALLVLDSARVQAVCDDMAKFGGGVVSSSLQFGIDGDVARDIRIRGEALRGDRQYRFLFPDYVVNGGDVGRIVAGAPREDSPVLIRDALFMELERLRAAGEKVVGRPDGRIYFIN